MPSCSCQPPDLLRRARRHCGPLNSGQRWGTPLRACAGSLFPRCSGAGRSSGGHAGPVGSVPGRSGLSQLGPGRSGPVYTRTPAPACSRPFSWRAPFLGAKSALRRELAASWTGFRNKVDFRRREKRFNTTPRPTNQPSASYSSSGPVVAVPRAAIRVYGRTR